MKRYKLSEAALIDRTCVQVRFSETDAMGVVWHGNYVKYFEDGRESFGKRYNLEYLQVHQKGYTIPIVELHCDYKHSVRFGQEIIIETRYIPCIAAKIKFEYVVYEKETMQIMATGSTTQVFLNAAGELELTNPPFYTDWLKQWEIEK